MRRLYRASDGKQPAPGERRRSDAEACDCEAVLVPEDHVGTETAITKMIYALGAWNASGSNALGDLIRKDPPTWASLLEIPEETLLRYVDVAPGCAIQANRKPPRQISRIS